LDGVVMSGAIGGSASTSKDSSPKTEKEDEEKHKQREKTAYVRPTVPIPYSSFPQHPLRDLSLI
jgi:hypothetical protein